MPQLIRKTCGQEKNLNLSVLISMQRNSCSCRAENRYSNNGITNLRYRFSHYHWIMIVITILATQMTSQVDSKVILFEEFSKQSSYQVNVDLYADDTYSNILPQTHTFTTKDTIFIEVNYMSNRHCWKILDLLDFSRSAVFLHFYHG